jgi:5-methyltetrahydrofolate--homocysteine methyltransferase
VPPSGTLRTRLHQDPPLLGDGGLATELFRRGLSGQEPPEAWTLTHPEVVSEVTRAYVDAGATWIQTNTFGASPLRLDARGMTPLTELLNTRAVALARTVGGDRALVLASVGPSGLAPRPEDPAWGPALQASFTRQIQALAGAGADGLLLETFTHLAEARLALTAARATAPHLAAAVTLVFESGSQGWRTLGGQPLREVVHSLEAAGAEALGANCMPGADNLRDLVIALQAETDLPLLIQPNAGIPKPSPDGWVYPEGPEPFAARLADLAGLGVRMVGGCCGTGPAHIHALRRRLGP